MTKETTKVAAQTKAATAAPQAAKSPTNRRKFLTGAAATAAGATAALAAPTPLSFSRAGRDGAPRPNPG